MKIAIDSRSLMNPPAGVANYLIAAVNQIARSHSSCLLYLLVNRDLDREAFGRIEKSKNVIIVKKPAKYFGRIGIIWYICKLFFILKEIKPDFFWTPANVLPPIMPKGIKTIVTVQDFVSKKHADTMMLTDRLYYSIFFNRSVQCANIITTLSNYTKGEVEKKFPNRRCADIYVGVSIDTKLFKIIPVDDKQKKELFDRFGIGEKFILFVGTIEPRKNLKFLISLMPELSKYDFKLLIVGAKGWKSTGIDRIMNARDFPGESIVFSGFVNKDDLVKFYNIASLMVLPSINEGFGLPALEAMSCGCPVVAADNSALHEVVLNGGMLVSGWEKSRWVNSIIEVYNNREKFREMGLVRSGEYHSKGKIEGLIDRIESEYL